MYIGSTDVTFQFKPSAIATAVILASVGLTGCGGGGGGGTTIVDPPPANSAPTDITLSANVVVENVAAAEVGTLTATDSNSGDTFTFSVNDDRFVIEGSTLRLANGTSLDYETDASVAISITVTDSGNASYSKEFTIDVTDVLEVTAPTTYAFESRFSSDSSVSYSGQIARHVLIAELFNYIGGQLQADVDNQVIASKADALAKMHSFYALSAEEYDLNAGDRALTISTTPGAQQTTLKQISSSHKDLTGKIAGNDTTGQHQDWSTAMAGWGAQGSTTPEAFAYHLMEQIANNVQTYINGSVRNDPNGNAINSLYVTETGIDLRQLLQKFLLGAVAFSQASDDYLDNTIEGKGLLADNTVADSDGTKPYTALEHAYDEGFGYFGAARNYNDYTDDEVAKKGGRDDWQGYHDTDGNGSIDLTAEYNFGNSTNASKRDRGTSANSNPTDFSKAAFDAFLMGRAIITDAAGTLDEMHMNGLLEQRDIILDNWEKSISATVVHYINETIADMAKLGNDDYNFATAAKHWAELKGFALNFQFNPYSPLSDEKFAELHTLIGDAPVVAIDGVEVYKAKLLEARALLQQAYDFDQENVEHW